MSDTVQAQGRLRAGTLVAHGRRRENAVRSLQLGRQSESTQQLAITIVRREFGEERIASYEHSDRVCAVRLLQLRDRRVEIVEPEMHLRHVAWRHVLGDSRDVGPNWNSINAAVDFRAVSTDILPFRARVLVVMARGCS